jgi:cytidine deaminase
VKYEEIDSQDQELIEAATDVIRRNYRKGRHSVGAAVLGASGRIYTGVNVESCGYGPCAEPVAIGAAIGNGEREFLSIVAVASRDQGYCLLSPCGNCRQLLVDYAPQAMVILERRGTAVKTAARNLLPAAYSHFDED